VVFWLRRWAQQVMRPAAPLPGGVAVIAACAFVGSAITPGGGPSGSRRPQGRRHRRRPSNDSAWKALLETLPGLFFNRNEEVDRVSQGGACRAHAVPRAIATALDAAEPDTGPRSRPRGRLRILSFDLIGRSLLPAPKPSAKLLHRYRQRLMKQGGTVLVRHRTPSEAAAPGPGPARVARALQLAAARTFCPSLDIPELGPVTRPITV